MRQGVLYGAVRHDAGEGAELGDQRELLLVLAAVCVEAALECWPDAQLAVGAAIFQKPVQLRLVALYVGVCRHRG